MGLVTRLVSPLEGEAKLPVHQFTAGIAEYRRGASTMTGADLVSKFNLTGDEINTLQQWQGVIDASGMDGGQWKGLLEDIFELGEWGQYSLTEVQTRLTDLGLEDESGT